MHCLNGDLGVVEGFVCICICCLLTLHSRALTWCSSYSFELSKVWYCLPACLNPFLLKLHWMKL